ncbi:hypothetical protein RFI_16608, partial [Reticulomyxa filosa]
MQATKEQLQKSQLKDQLKRDIEERIDPDEITKRESIYKTQMQANREQLQKSKIRDTVKNELHNRSSVTELESAGLLVFHTSFMYSYEQYAPFYLLWDNIHKREKDISARSYVHVFLLFPLQASKQQLERSLIKDQLKSEMEERRETKKGTLGDVEEVEEEHEHEQEQEQEQEADRESAQVEYLNVCHLYSIFVFTIYSPLLSWS